MTFSVHIIGLLISKTQSLTVESSLPQAVQLKGILENN